MKNRITVRHGMLRDLKAYLTQSGWKLESPIGQYEVLRARRKGYPRPLIDERDMKVYQGWQKSRRRRGLDPNWPSGEEELEERSAIWRGERIE